MKLNLSSTTVKNETKNAAKLVNNRVIIATVPSPVREIEDAIAEEIVDVAPAAPAPKAETPKAEPKKDVKLKRKVQLKKKTPAKKSAPKAAAPKAETKAKYSVQEYQTKKGGTAYLLFGFDSMEHAEKVAAECSKTIGASWRYVDNEKRFCLSMGTRYGEVARELCSALNKGDYKAAEKAAAKSHDVYAMAVAAGKAEREIKKQEREAKAKAEAAKAAEAKADEEPAPEKSYSKADVAAMLREVLAGKELPKEVAELMAA